MDAGFADIPEDEILSAEFWEDKANELFSSNRYREAIIFYDRAIAIRPDYAKARYNRGVALERLGRYDDALTSFERAMDLEPDCQQVWRGKSWALRMLGRAKEAEEAFGKAWELG